MKFIYKLFILLLFVFIVSGCSNGSSSNESTGENTVQETAYVTFRYDKESSSYIGKAFWKATTTTQKVLCDPVYLQNVKWYSVNENGVTDNWHLLGTNIVDSTAGTITSNVRIYTFSNLDIAATGKKTNGQDSRNICDQWAGCHNIDMERYKEHTIIVTITFVAPYDTPITVGQQTGFNSQND